MRLFVCLSIIYKNKTEILAEKISIPVYILNKYIRFWKDYRFLINFVRYFMIMKKYLIFILTIIHFSVLAQLSVEFTQLNTSCSSSCGGIVQATAIGGTQPYTYDWKTAAVDPDNENIGINLCGGTHQFSIIDGNGDRIDTTFFVAVLKAPEIIINTSPGDTLYIQNPTVQFFFENLDEETNPVSEWVWDFGDNNTTDIQSPIHTYTNVQDYYPSLQIIYAEGCDTAYVNPLTVKTVELFIPNIITPNGDGKNDVFVITDKNEVSGGADQNGFSLINDFYISNELIISNRWGQKVYECKNYLNDWDGDQLVDGVYFYVLKCQGKFKDETFRGSLTILGNK